MIIFENDGIVPLEAFTTFGMSAKPGSTNPIGKFGTGLKYAVAVTLRLGGTFKLFRGEEEYEFYTKEEDFRGKTFAKVRMRRRAGLLSKWRYDALPFTTELGKHWKPWMAVRELEANCRDENGHSMIVSNDERDHAFPVAGRTLIVIDCAEMEDAFANLDDIFLPEARQPIYEDSKVAIYEGGSQHLFYRRMRVTDLRKPSLFTYEMKDVFLTEDRTSMYSFLDNQNIMRSLLACPDQDIVQRVVKEAENHHESTFDWDEKKPRVSHAWYPVLSSTGLSSRFSALRDNLDFGIGATETVEIEMEVRMWERVLDTMRDVDESIYLQIKEQLVEAGWKAPAEVASVDEDLEAADAVEELAEEDA